MAVKVDVIKANTSLTDRRRKTVIERKRVAAYCRVSTDSEDQLHSYRSQVDYYTNMITNEKDWMMAGVYADEGITGTQVTKREQFQKMIKDCMNGQIDMVITKSISRFARNTLDTLKYVRQLKEKNIAVYFEDEKINTLSMDGELLLVVLSSVAQQEVENISANTKKGIAMKMSRGEMVGFARALGYNYDPETKTISINEEEAKIVRFIFDEYVKGNGARVIAHKLEAMGALTAYGCKHWQETTIIGIIRNEKYMGDLVQGKTFTVDPISHRRLDNQGEVNKYVVKDHHEAIVSEEVWNKAQAILEKRSPSHSNPLADPEHRTKFSRKYTFSCMMQCGFCESTLTRRTRNHQTKYKQVVWHCVAATKGGKKKCPQCKAIPESVVEDAFVESFNLITDQHKEVLEEFWKRIEETLHSKEVDLTVQKIKNDLALLEKKKKRLLDMRLESRIDMNTYLAKDDELKKDIAQKRAELSKLQDTEKTEKEMRRHIDEMREYLKDAQPLKKFDCQVFESIVEKVIIGGYDDSGNADPLKITFVYKTGFTDDKDGRDFKHSRRHIGGPKPRKLLQETDNEASEKVQLNDDEARRDRGSAKKNKLKEGWKSPCLSHFCGIRLSEKRGWCRVFF
ncbi:MAG: recombinase family protein [Oribacterium sp.]|nr:recombinase family protein [Oribacterium sp.]